jgi:hypothetical protein
MYTFSLPDTLVHRTLLVLSFVCLVAAAACGRGRAPEQFHQKLVVLGFDGLDPRLVQQWMADGRLPNMQKLAKRRIRPSRRPRGPRSPPA